MRPSDYFNNCIGVFQGGGCKAIAYIGAYKRAHKLGIMFSEVAGTSAGSIIAAMIAIGCSPQKLEKIIKGTDFKSLAKRAKYKHSRFLRHVLEFIFLVIYLWVAFGISLLLPVYVLYYFIKVCAIVPIIVFRYFAHKSTRRYFNKLSSFKFFKAYRIAYFSISALIHHSWGLFDTTVIKEKIEEWFRECGVREDITFGELSVQLHVVATDVFKRQAKVWNGQKTPHASVSKAVAASCSIPIFFTPIDWVYVDGGIMSNRPDYIFYKNKHKYTKVLSFSFKNSTSHYRTRFGFLSDLISAIIDGSDKLQHDMLPELPDTIIIDHGDVEATSFNKINNSKIEELISYGTTAVDNFLNALTQGDLINLINNSSGTITSRERIYTQIASWAFSAPKRVIIYEPTLDWVWSLFPTLISWINSGTKIVVYREDNALEKSKTDSYRRIKKIKNCNNADAKLYFSERIEIRNSRQRLLDILGCRIKPYRHNKIKGFFFKYLEKPFIGIGIKYPEQYGLIYAENDIIAKIYTDSVDSSLLTEQFSSLNVNEDFKNMPTPKRCEVIQNDEIRLEIERRLHNIVYYRSAQFEWISIDIEQLIFLNSRLRGFKYTQDMHIFEMYKNLTLFDASALNLQNNKLSYMAPIVVEEHQNKLFVIKGNTRCLYAWRHGIRRLKVLVVKHIDYQLPIDGDIQEFHIDNLFVSEEPISGVSRYGNKFRKDLYRPIEEVLRPYNTYLT